MKIAFSLILTCCILFSCRENKTARQGAFTDDSAVVSLAPPETNMDSLQKIAAAKNVMRYDVIKNTKTIPGFIDTVVIKELPEYLKALTAFYSALGGSNCTGENCDLTLALGLGRQGSKAHKALIMKWLSKDKAANTAVKQDCYQRPSGASSFSDYVFFGFVQTGDTIVVKYDLMYYNRGDVDHIKGPDKYLIRGGDLITLNRNIWKDDN